MPEIDHYEPSALAGPLVAGWRWWLLAALLAGLLALGMAALDPDRYRAEALLAVARPASLSFDPRFSEVESGGFPRRVGSLRTYPELARSSGMALALRERRPDLVDPQVEPDALLARIEVESRAEGTLIAITARADRPEEAAALANAWAEILAERADALFGAAEDTQGVQTARDEARDRLDEAVVALASFDESGRLSRAEAEQASLELGLSRRMAAARRLEALEADLAGLRAQVAAGGARGSSLVLAELQRSALASLPEERPEWSLDSGAWESGIDSGEIDALSAQAEAARRALDEEIEGIADRLAAARAELTRARAERNALERQQGLADERHLTLSRKLDELRVAEAATRPELRLASRAAPSESLPWADWARQVLVAALLGAALAAGWLLWRAERAP